MITVKAVLNRDRKKKCGGYSLVVQIIRRRVRRIIYTPYVLRETEFDPVSQKAVYTDGQRFSRKQIREINDFVAHKMHELSHIIDFISARNPNYIAEDIICKYRQDQSDKYLITFCERLIAKKEALNKMGTAKAIRSTLRSLGRYIGRREVTFGDIDHHFVRDYENYLYSTGVVQNTVGFYMRNFQMIYNLAYDSGVEMSDNQAFCKIQIRHSKTVKRALKQEVIRRIATLDLTRSEHLDRARDLFMFSFYTRGMCFVDIVHLKHTDIVDGVIRYRRHKTNQYLQVAVTEPLQKLIDKYSGDQTYVLPFLSESTQPTLYKKYLAVYGVLYRSLKELQELLNIITPLTFHLARHSWATIAKEQGAPTAAISEGLGHTSEKTTIIYLKEFDHSIIDMMNEKIVSLSMSAMN